MNRYLAGIHKQLVGRVITTVRELTTGELEELYGMTGQGGILIGLDDGTLVIPQRDDEGNGPGALFIQPPSRKGRQ